MVTTKQEKQEYANTMATLLSLDRFMEKDLMKLDVETLAKMYVQYIQNAKDCNHKIEQVAGACKC